MTLLFVLHPFQHGWRWAIYLATRAQFDADPLSNCVNAGFQVEQADADAEGQTCLYTVISFCSRIRVKVQTVPVTLDHDPLPVVEIEAVQVSPEVVQMGVQMGVAE